MVGAYVEELLKSGPTKKFSQQRAGCYTVLSATGKNSVALVPQRATPLSTRLLMAFAGTASHWGQHTFAHLLVVAFAERESCSI